MSNPVDTILEKVADYIAVTQPKIDEYNENREAFMKRANQVAGVLMTRGILPRERVDAFLSKIASDASGACVWDLIEKLAEALPVETLGGEADVKLANPQNMDSFEKWIRFGDARYQEQSTGNIE